jgi:hypothetical protein
MPAHQKPVSYQTIHRIKTALEFSLKYFQCLEMNASLKIPGQWPVEKAQAWYTKQPWLVGCNYIPANAINQIDMWQEETFDLPTIERELKLAESIGFNTLRVYLHDLVWGADPDGLYNRMDQFLTLCASLSIRPLFVFFDDCHWPFPTLGKQPLPVQEFHNSGWVNCPAQDVAVRFIKGESPPEEIDRLRGYVQGTLKRFGQDERVLAWELYNEPGRGPGLSDAADETFGNDRVPLVLASWKWAREVENVSQPLCSCADGSVGEKMIEIGRLNSDIISFHNYDRPDELEKMCKCYVDRGRPALCTEYMGRPNSTFQSSLPIFKKYNIGAYNWGFVAGKTGTIWHWTYNNGKDVDALRKQGVVLQPGEPMPEPELWFHDIFREDGTPFDPAEIDCIRHYTEAG